MGERTSIEWTDATFNPWWGCTKISPGCDHCYAEGIAQRFAPGMWGAQGSRREFGDNHWRRPENWNRAAERAGERMLVFVASMADWADNHSIAKKHRPRLFRLIEDTPWLDWQMLTKRIGNVAGMVPAHWMEGRWPRNAWLGATIVNQDEANRDIPKLLLLPAAIRFVSCEPLLGAIDLTRISMGESGVVWTKDVPDEFRSIRTLKFRMNALTGAPKTGIPGLNWVIAGGESGNSARPMHPDWARGLRDQCEGAGVPFLFKQWGKYEPNETKASRIFVYRDGGTDIPDFRAADYDANGETAMAAMGNENRLLDGRTWDQFPTTEKAHG